MFLLLKNIDVGKHNLPVLNLLTYFSQKNIYILAKFLFVTAIKKTGRAKMRHYFRFRQVFCVLNNWLTKDFRGPGKR
jgi:hypothetical protein